MNTTGKCQLLRNFLSAFFETIQKRCTYSNSTIEIRGKCETCPKLMKKTTERRQWRYSDIFIVNLLYFTPFSSVSVPDFEQVDVCWEYNDFRNLRGINLLSQNLSIFHCYIRSHNIWCSCPPYQWLLLSEIYLKHCITAGIYLFKISNGITKTACEICSKLTIKPPERLRQWRHSGVLVVKYEQISQIVLCFYC